MSAYFSVLDTTLSNRCTGGCLNNCSESNSQGTITQRFDYKPFGEGTPTQKAGVGYTGHLEDTDLGLTYMQQRYYDPVIGRFYSNDPVGFTADNPMMFNRYAYANNNPYRFTDPDGKSPKLLRPIIKAIKNDGDVVKALKESGVEIGESLSTIANPNSSAADIAGAVFDLVSPVSTGEVSKGAQLLKNSLQGAIGEAKTAAKLGDNVAGKQVTFITSTGERARPDFVTSSGGIVETKTGGGLSSGQAQLAKDIASGTPVTPVGANAKAAGFTPGQPVILNNFKVDNQ